MHRVQVVQVRHIAVLLLAGCLAGCGYAAIDSDLSAFTLSSKQMALLKGDQQGTASGSTESTGSIPDTASSASANNGPDRADAAAMTSLFARAAGEKPADRPPASVPSAVPAAKSGVSTAASTAPTAAPAKPVVVADAETGIPAANPPAAAEKLANEPPRGRAYLFRGVAGLIYSRGMDKLADRIKRAGIPSSVETYLMWRPVADQAIRDYRRDPQPIIIIGHSMGGDSALAFAETLNAENIPVNLLVTYDPTRIADNVPPNVERYINIFQSSNFMGGGNVVQGPRFHGHYASYNLKDHREIVHINIEKADRIQEQLVTKVRELAATPAAGEGEAVPIHLEVPAEASVELWDSGTPITAHAGDTLKTLAANYHVPLWALDQINTESERAPLAEGERIVIPRRLVPAAAAATVTSYAPMGR